MRVSVYGCLSERRSHWPSPLVERDTRFDLRVHRRQRTCIPRIARCRAHFGSFRDESTSPRGCCVMEFPVTCCSFLTITVSSNTEPAVEPVARNGKSARPRGVGSSIMPKFDIEREGGFRGGALPFHLPVFFFFFSVLKFFLFSLLWGLSLRHVTRMSLSFPSVCVCFVSPRRRLVLSGR